MLPDIFNNVDAVFFDLDNTLVSRDRAFRNILPTWLRNNTKVPEEAYSAEAERILQKDNHGYSNWLEVGHWLCSTYMPGRSFSRSILTEISLLIAQNIRPDDRVISLIEKIKENHLVGIISNGSSRTQRMKIANAGLESLFRPDTIYIDEEVKFSKPHPYIFSLPVQDHQIPANRFLYIGDNPVNDIEGASNFGMNTCWIKIDPTLYNFITPPQLIISDITDLLQ